MVCGRKSSPYFMYNTISLNTGVWLCPITHITQILYTAYVKKMYDPVLPDDFV